jgi:DNA-binding CsgD family transcriptional regulator
MATKAKRLVATSKRRTPRATVPTETHRPPVTKDLKTNAASVQFITGVDSKLLDRLNRKHPDVDRRTLESYLSKPLDEQPLWLNSAMSAEERKKVIGDFVTFSKKARMAPPLKGQDNQSYRAIKRQTRLTFKQWQVGRLTVQGLDIKEIATQLEISGRMVKTHLQAIRRKAKLDRNAKIVLWFLGC